MTINVTAPILDQAARAYSWSWMVDPEHLFKQARGLNFADSQPNDAFTISRELLLPLL